MTRERWEQILFAHVSDEVVQDMLNEYVLEVESENARLRRLVESEVFCMSAPSCRGCPAYRPADDGWCDQGTWLNELGIEVPDV